MSVQKLALTIALVSFSASASEKPEKPVPGKLSNNQICAGIAAPFWVSEPVTGPFIASGVFLTCKLIKQNKDIKKALAEKQASQENR